MTRPKNATRTTRVAPTIPEPAYAQLERLAEIGLLGSNPTEVAKYLITRGLDDIMRSGALPPEAKPKAASH
jgi:hypothetical protein